MIPDMKCMLLDDEPLARKGIEKYIRELPQLRLVASCGSVSELLAAMKEGKPDLLFLDIQMPRITGIDLLRSVKNLPLTIITSAYSEYALQGYEFDVIDYLVKPISFQRFLKAVNKAADFLNTTNYPEKQPQDFFFIKCNNKYERIRYDELVFIESLQNYVIVKTSDRNLICYLTLKMLEAHLPPDRFLRVDKSAIISLSQIDNIEGNNKINIGGHSFPISRKNKDSILKKILRKTVLDRDTPQD
jgi:DNA-binding LytR/AlgR family response regulator